MNSLFAHPVRILQYAALIGFEATLIHLLGTLLTLGAVSPALNWAVVVVVITVAAVATLWLEPVLLTAEHVRRPTALLALATVLWATKAHLSDPNPLTGWSALGRLFNLDDPRFFLAYLALVVSLWAWTRGAQVVDTGHADVLQRLRFGIVALATLMLLRPLMGLAFGAALGERRISIAAEVVWFLLLGLVSLSLTRIVALEGEGVRSAQWRWMRSGVASTVLTLLIGLLGLSLMGDTAGAVLRITGMWGFYLFTLVVTPLVILIFIIMDFLRLDQLLQMVIAALGLNTNFQPGDEQPAELVDRAPLMLPEALLRIPVIILVLIPIIVLLVLIIFARRRRPQPNDASDEQHESIFSWDAVGDDLRRWLQSLRRATRPGDGLSAALAHLRGDDPVTRIRRRYVQLLQRGAAAGRMRRHEQTPREFAPDLALHTDEAARVATLTRSYERARYDPTGVDMTDAQQADQAWQELSHNRPPNS